MLTQEQVKNIKWYRQSGAGIPLCIGMPFLGIAIMDKVSGFHYPNDLGTFLKTEKGFTFYHYFDYFLTLEQVKNIFYTLQKDPGHFAELKEKFYKAGPKMEAEGLAILEKSVFSAEFQQGYQKMYNYTMDFWGNSLYVDLMDPFEIQVIDFIFGERKKEVNKAELNILMSPDELSNYQKQQAELLELEKVAQEKGIESTEVANGAKELSRKYYWLKNDYEKVEFLDDNYFLNEIKRLMANPQEVATIASGLQKSRELQTAKKQIIAKYKFAAKLVEHLNFFNWVTTLRDDRKKYNQISNYVLIKTIEKIAEESGIDLELLKYAMPNEIIQIINKDAKILAELEKRANLGLIVFADTIEVLEVYSGKIAKEYFDIIESTIAASEIKGTTASPGKVIGTARIILSQHDFDKMKPGDIIVASMTRPEYVPIMKIALAIVTDEGGITSHAAIVSREMNIPCITGTQVATRSLQDGDLIDVNADHGLVKIVKRA
ncbi:MAG: PEP-utilizing enzyme [Candidatus Parcubacteria bacterium]|nr:PEP-utilizing enzyme [Candidatus Parcubacteria bacterium]